MESLMHVKPDMKPLQIQQRVVLCGIGIYRQEHQRNAQDGSRRLSMKATGCLYMYKYIHFVSLQVWTGTGSYYNSLTNSGGRKMNLLFLGYQPYFSKDVSDDIIHTILVICICLRYLMIQDCIKNTPNVAFYTQSSERKTLCTYGLII